MCSVVNDVLEVQAKEQERREESEKVLAAKEKGREKRADEREQKFMESMSTMSVMSQFRGRTMMFGFPPAYMPSASPPVTAILSPAPLMYPYMGAPFPGPSPTTAIPQVATTTVALSLIAAPSSAICSISTEEGDDRKLTLLLYLHCLPYSRHMLHLLYFQSVLSLLGPFHMATRKRFSAFTCPLKPVSKRFETGLTKPASHQVSLETVLEKPVSKCEKRQRDNAYGAKARQEHF